MAAFPPRNDLRVTFDPVAVVSIRPRSPAFLHLARIIILQLLLPPLLLDC